MEVIQTRSRKTVSLGPITVGAGELVEALRLIPSSSSIEVLTGDTFSRERVKLSGFVDVEENKSQMSVPMEVQIEDVAIYFRKRSVEIYFPHDKEVAIKPFVKRVNSFEPWLNVFNGIVPLTLLLVGFSFAASSFLNQFYSSKIEAQIASFVASAVFAGVFFAYLHFKNVSKIYDDNRAGFLRRNRDVLIALLAVISTAVVDYLIP